MHDPALIIDLPPIVVLLRSKDGAAYCFRGHPQITSAQFCNFLPPPLRYSLKLPQITIFVLSFHPYLWMPPYPNIASTDMGKKPPYNAKG